MVPTVIPKGGCERLFQRVVPKGVSKGWSQRVVPKGDCKGWFQRVVPKGGPKGWSLKGGHQRVVTKGGHLYHAPRYCAGHRVPADSNSGSTGASRSTACNTMDSYSQPRRASPVLIHPPSLKHRCVLLMKGAGLSNTSGAMRAGWVTRRPR